MNEPPHNRLVTPWLVLAGAMIAWAASQLAWIARQGELSASVCCTFVQPPLAVVRALHSGIGLRTLYGMRLDAWMAAGAWYLAGGRPEFGLWLLVLAGLAGQLFAFLLARRLAGPWAGVLAAALLPVVPGIAFLLQRWDTYGLLVPVLLAAAWLAVESRGLTRPLPTLGFTVVALVAAFSSPRYTDDLLAMAALAALAGAGVVRNLVLGRGPTGEPVSRGATLLGGLAVAAVVGVVAVNWLEPDSAEGIGYQVRQLDHAPWLQGRSPWSVAVLGAYAGHTFWRVLTPWLAVPFEVAAVVFLRQGRGRAELAGWLVLPMVALSVIPKKNFYYPSVTWPALVVILAVGIAALPWRRLRWTAGLGVLLVGMTQYADRSVTGLLPYPVQWQRGDVTYGGIMQTSDNGMSLAPRARDYTSLITLLERSLPDMPCDCDPTVALLGNMAPGDLALRIAQSRPCYLVRDGRPAQAVERWTAMLVELPPGPADSGGQDWVPFAEALVKGGGFDPAGSAPGDAAEATVYVRPQAWLDQACSGHVD